MVAPATLGVVGTVASCPGGEIAVGTRAVPNGVLDCGRCWWCERHQPRLCPKLAVRGLQADGGLAEYMTVEAHTCFVIPDETPVEVAAVALLANGTLRTGPLLTEVAPLTEVAGDGFERLAADPTAPKIPVAP